MANSVEIIPFWLFLDINHLRPVYVLGSIVSYLAIIFNIFIVGILCQNLFVSPSTVLIQGLALADGLTALFTYGFEPFFVSKYDENFYLLLKSVTSEEVRANVFVTLGYPDCKFYLLTNHLAECCHLISVCFTMCIGLQKVVAMRFPIWTRIKLTVWKSVICSLVCFLVPIAISIPGMTALSLQSVEIESFKMCEMKLNERTAKYGYLYQPLLTAVIVTTLSLVMVFTSVYIVYKLCMNKVRQRKISVREKRSVLLVLVLLCTFLVSEIPRIFSNIVFVWFVIVSNKTSDLEEGNIVTYTLTDIQFYKVVGGFGALYFKSKISNSPIFYDFLPKARNYLEVIKFFTIVACLLNMFIYIFMSQKLRRYLKTIFIIRCKT